MSIRIEVRSERIVLQTLVYQLGASRNVQLNRPALGGFLKFCMR